MGLSERGFEITPAQNPSSPHCAACLAGDLRKHPGTLSLCLLLPVIPPPTAAYSAITALHRQRGLPAPRAPRHFCLGASAHAPRSLGGVFLPQLCLPIEAQIRLPIPSKTCLNIPIFSAFCSSQLLPHLQSYLCVISRLVVSDSL